MTDSEINVNAATVTPPAAPKPEAGRGITSDGRVMRIVDFRTAGDAYLEKLRADLGLDCSLDDLKTLRAFFGGLLRDPTVPELIFYLDLLRTGAFDTADVCVDSVVAAPGEDCTAPAELLSELIYAYNRTRSDTSVPPALTRLGEFAATRHTAVHPLTVSLSHVAAPAAPAFTGRAQQLFEADGYYLSVSEGLPRRGDVRPYAALLRPAEGMSAADCLIAADQLLSARYDRRPDSLILPLTGRGLLPELMNLDCAFRTDTAAIAPGAPLSAALEPLSPAWLVFLEQNEILSFGQSAAEAGLRCTFPASRLPGAASEIVSGKAKVSFKPGYAREFSRVRTAAQRIAPLVLFGDNTPVPAVLLSSGEQRFAVSSVRIGAENEGELFDRLCGLFAADCDAFAVAGTLNPDDGSALPLILTLDAAAAAVEGKTVAARFSIAKATSLTVFCLRK